METTEKKVSHTPGPWKIITTKDVTIIRIGTDIVYSHGKNEANVKLMAAGPELLEALQMALGELKAAHSLTEWTTINMQKMSEKQIKKIENAIKRATE